ncbi:MAG: SusC/RagA family TonB-linked outer membrane protein, partial [Chitinophagaceae bacterium]|nr:SusC/RagA family TonB-linked outer membrane protein [Chitinophagaceae bacterium]
AKQPLSGVTVAAGKTSVITNENGQYSIPASPGQDLQFSYVGMTSLTVPADRSGIVDVSMDAGVSDLDEIVVTGYKTERKKDLTGAVAIVNMADIKNIPASSPMLAIQGRVPGLYVESDGSPNGGSRRILIRGLNNLGNSDPLYIIDGVPTKGPQVFASLAPNSISSVQVLKDASAASIYGARASNGVIIVTTKDGHSASGASKVNIQFNSSISLQNAAPSFEKVLNSQQRGEVLWRAAVNDHTDPVVHSAIYTYDWNGDYNNPVLNKVNIQPFVGGDTTEPVGNTNWQKEAYKTGIISQNDLTVTAGNGNSGLMINLGYYKNTGTLVFTNFERFSARINSFASMLNGKLRIGENLLLARTTQTLQTTDLGGAPTPNLSVILAPTIPVYTTTGKFAGPNGAGYTDRNNPVDMQYQNRFDKNNQVNLFGNVYLEAQLSKNLLFRSSIGGDYTSSLSKDIQPAFHEGFLGRDVNSLALQQGNNLSIAFTNTLNYSLEISKHRISVLAGTEAIKQDNQGFGAFRESFAIEDVNYYYLNAGIGRNGNNGTNTGYRLFSQFGKIGYSFSDKYLASATLRRDGSSRFGANNKYGIFPAVTAGWRISNEDFFKNVSAVSNLKVRAGLGRVGNQEIGDLARFGLLRPNYGPVSPTMAWLNTGTAYDLSGADGGTLPSGYVQVQAANPDLKWETTNELNIGVDFGLFNEHLSGSVDYFTRKTKDILI